MFNTQLLKWLTHSFGSNFKKICQIQPPRALCLWSIFWDCFGKYSTSNREGGTGHLTNYPSYREAMITTKGVLTTSKETVSWVNLNLLYSFTCQTKRYQTILPMVNSKLFVYRNVGIKWIRWVWNPSMCFIYLSKITFKHMIATYGHETTRLVYKTYYIYIREDMHTYVWWHVLQWQYVFFNL